MIDLSRTGKPTKHTVSYGKGTHTIYVYDPDNVMFKPVACSQACINAVMDYMMDDFPTGDASVGYERKLKSGKTCKLVCYVED